MVFCRRSEWLWEDPHLHGTGRRISQTGAFRPLSGLAGRRCPTESSPYGRQLYNGAAALQGSGCVDLFKTKSGFLQDVSNADVKLAFELLDYRCRNRMLTILSTEWTTAQLIEVDEALAGRIIRMARGYTICVKKDRNKNYRLKGADG